MIRITVELVPFGTGEPVHLGTAIIANDGSGTHTRGHYAFWLSKKGAPESQWKGGAVRDFPRKRLGAWDLLYRCLRDAVGPRNP